jgi:uncharacterized protein (DUF1778 family)
MKKTKTAIRTKRPMVHATFRLKREEREIWREAAAKLGESLNEFVRVAVTERGRRVILKDHRSAETGSDRRLSA